MSGDEAHLKLGITLEEIGESSCTVCEGPTEKKFVTLHQRYVEDGRQRVVTVQVPGYRCESCEVETYDSKASIKALKAAREVVKEAGDSQTLEMIDASIRAGEQHVARWQSIE